MVTTNSKRQVVPQERFGGRSVLPNHSGKLREFVQMWRPKLKYLEFPPHQVCLKLWYGETGSANLNEGYVYVRGVGDSALKTVRCLPVAKLCGMDYVQPARQYPEGTIQDHFLALSRNGRWLRLVCFRLPGKGYGELQLWWVYNEEIEQIIKMDPELKRIIRQNLEEKAMAVITCKEARVESLRRTFERARTFAQSFSFASDFQS